MSPEKLPQGQALRDAKSAADACKFARETGRRLSEQEVARLEAEECRLLQARLRGEMYARRGE
jgi:hypothetical protein